MRTKQIITNGTLSNKGKEVFHFFNTSLKIVCGDANKLQSGFQSRLLQVEKRP
jgi:hypothetical protein